MVVATSTDSPYSVRNRCLIEHFGDVFVLTLLFIFRWCMGFYYRIESDPLIFLFVL